MHRFVESPLHQRTELIQSEIDSFRSDILRLMRNSLQRASFECAERLIDFLKSLHQLSEIRQLFLMGDKPTVSSIARRLKLSRNGVYARLESLGVSIDQFRQKLPLNELVHHSDVLRPIAEQIEDDLHDGEAANGLEELTRIQELVLVEAAKGKSLGEIANQLELSRKTVAIHLRKIKHKLGAKDRLELALIAIRSGLVEP